MGTAEVETTTKDSIPVLDYGLQVVSRSVGAQVNRVGRFHSPADPLDWDPSLLGDIECVDAQMKVHWLAPRGALCAVASLLWQPALHSLKFGQLGKECIEDRHKSPDRPWIAARERPVTREQHAREMSSRLKFCDSEWPVVSHVLCNDCAPFCPGDAKDHLIGLTAELRSFCNTVDIVSTPPEFIGDRRGPHLIEEQLQLRNSSCSCRQIFSAEAASSSTCSIHARISSRYSA